MLKIGSKVCLVGVLGALGMRAIDMQQPQSERANAQEHVPARHRSSATSPAARYSPLAAAGGYRGQQTTWYEAALRSLNPNNIDWGERWEQRRAAFLENTIGNRYFVLSVLLVLSFYAALVAIGWIVRDHKQDIRYFETELMKARTWAAYWKNRALEAIGKYNDHVDKCNRVIESGESFSASNESSSKKELEDLRTDVANLKTEKARLTAELDTKKQATAALGARVEELEKTIGTGLNNSRSVEQTDKAALMGRRVKHLEERLAAATQKNDRLKGA